MSGIRSLFIVLGACILVSCEKPYHPNEKAFMELKALAAAGNVEAQYKLGETYYKGIDVGRNDVEAIKWFTAASQKNHPKAQNKLGLMYRGGIAVEKNYREAIQWFKKAANQGLPEAQYNLAIMYDGTHGRANHEEMIALLISSANQGYASAQFALGSLYAIDDADLVEAYKWADLACDTNERGATELRTELEKKMTRVQISEGKKRAALLRSEQN